MISNARIPCRLSPLLPAVLSLALGACQTAQKPQATAVATTTGWGVETQNISKSIAPGDDFYRYVNQGYLDNNVIPPGFPMNGSFVDLMLSTEDKLKTIIETAMAAKAPSGTPTQQVADLYASYVDMTRREAQGIGMLQDELAALRRANSHGEIAQRLGQIGYLPPFTLSVEVDADDPQHYRLAVEQGGLGLPGLEMYLKKGAPYDVYRSAYLDYIEAAFRRAGFDRAKQRARAILAFETAIAGKHWTPEQMRTPAQTNHPMSRAELIRFAPGFDWEAFLNASGFSGVGKVNATTDAALKNIASIWAKTPLDTLKSYAAFHYLDAHADLVSDAWNLAQFDLFSRKLNGIDQRRTVEQRGITLVSNLLSEPVGKLYVERYFPPESKAQMEELVGYLQTAMRERLEKLDWMDEPTRREALTKLAQFRVKIGYPDHWRDFSTVRIQADDLVGNAHRLAQWTRDDHRRKLDEPVRTWEWEKAPHEINASYEPSRNEICFPAGILQAPFFSPSADPAVNFGAIGTVIGHEIGHGFDDQGSRYDGAGKLRNWWSPASDAKFRERADRLAAQFSRYEPLPGLHVNGRLTLGENIGDLGGVTIAYDAYRKYLASHEPSGQAPLIDGFTGDQRFFLGQAQVWRAKVTDGFLRNWVQKDVHSPSEYRVNGVVLNIDPWYEAFGVTEKNKLYRPQEERIRIW